MNKTYKINYHVTKEDGNFHYWFDAHVFNDAETVFATKDYDAFQKFTASLRKAGYDYQKETPDTAVNADLKVSYEHAEIVTVTQAELDAEQEDADNGILY